MRPFLGFYARLVLIYLLTVEIRLYDRKITSIERIAEMMVTTVMKELHDEIKQGGCLGRKPFNTIQTYIPESIMFKFPPNSTRNQE